MVSAQGDHTVTRSLVTGGSGYFGSLLVRQLLERGDDVRVLDISDADDRSADVEFIRGDIRVRDSVDRAVHGVDRVFHNVAQVPLARDEYLLRSVNVDGTRTLLDACHAANVGKVIHTSSSAVFGVPERNPVLPTDVPKPGESYGHAKLAAEWACLDAVAHGLDVSIVRPRTILGHGRLGIFGILFDWIADGADPLVLGTGANRYQFVHADDLAAACILESDHAGHAILNVGAVEVNTMYDTLATLCAHADTGAEVRSLPTAPALAAMHVGSRLGLLPFAPYHWLMYSKSMWFDTDHVRERLDWQPQYSTHAMFVESYEWFLENRAATNSASASHHRRSTRQGALAIAKRLTRYLPRAG